MNEKLMKILKMFIVPISLYVCLNVIGVKIIMQTPVDVNSKNTTTTVNNCPLFELPNTPPPPPLPPLSEEQLKDKNALSVVLLNHVKAQTQYFIMVDRINKEAYDRYRKCHAGS